MVGTILVYPCDSPPYDGLQQILCEKLGFINSLDATSSWSARLGFTTVGLWTVDINFDQFVRVLYV